MQSLAKAAGPAVFVAMATPVAAQQVGSILPDSRGQLSGRNLSPEDRGREVANGYAACLLGKRATGVRRALAQDTDEEVDHALDQLIVSDCLAESELRMPASLMRGSLYRAMYLQKFGRTPPVQAERVATAPNEERKTPETLRAFGDCVVAADPLDSRTLVMANPATPAERQALEGLRPVLRSCISPTSQIRLTRSVLQAVIAESAYRAATSSVVNK